MPTDLKYTARDYATIRTMMLGDIPAKTPEWTNLNEGELGVALLELLAGGLDILSFSLDNNAMETFLDTAVARADVQSILRGIGYEMKRRTAATVSITLTLSAALGADYVLPSPLILSTQDGSLQFVVLTPLTLLAGQTQITATAYQGIYHSEGPFTASGADLQSYALAFPFIADNLLHVIVNGVTWTEEKTIDPFPTSIVTIYTAQEDDSGITTILFDKFRGSVPASGQSISFVYVCPDGVAGNIGAGLVNTFVSTLPSLPVGITLAVTNPLPSGGGLDREATGAAKINGPRTLRTLNRAVTVQDYLDLILLQPGVDSVSAANHPAYVELYVRLLYNAGWPVFKTESLILNTAALDNTGGTIAQNQTVYVTVTVTDANGESNNRVVNPTTGAPYTTVATVVVPADAISTHKIRVRFMAGAIDDSPRILTVNVYVGTSLDAMYFYATTTLSGIVGSDFSITSIPTSGTLLPTVDNTGLHNAATGRSYYADIFDFLSARRTLCTAFDLFEAHQVTQNITGSILVADNFKQADVRTNVVNAVQSFLAAWPLGKTLYLSELEAYIRNNVDGVKNVTITLPTTDTGIASSQYFVAGTITITALGGIA